MEIFGAWPIVLILLFAGVALHRFDSHPGRGATLFASTLFGIFHAFLVGSWAIDSGVSGEGFLLILLFGLPGIIPGIVFAGLFSFLGDTVAVILAIALGDTIVAYVAVRAFVIIRQWRLRNAGALQ